MTKSLMILAAIAAGILGASSTRAADTASPQASAPPGFTASGIPLPGMPLGRARNALSNANDDGTALLYSTDLQGMRWNVRAYHDDIRLTQIIYVRDVQDKDPQHCLKNDTPLSALVVEQFGQPASGVLEAKFEEKPPSLQHYHGYKDGLMVRSFIYVDHNEPSCHLGFAVENKKIPF